MNNQPSPFHSCPSPYSTTGKGAVWLQNAHPGVEQQLVCRQLNARQALAPGNKHLPGLRQSNRGNEADSLGKSLLNYGEGPRPPEPMRPRQGISQKEGLQTFIKMNCTFLEKLILKVVFTRIKSISAQGKVMSGVGLGGREGRECEIIMC